jgi:hypothetical protein
MEFIYTPQQLAGYKGYNQRVRIGNWTEDQVQIDSRIADYIHKKKSGSLKCTQAEARFTKVCAPQELNGRDDVVRFGENVMLFNEESNGCVAYDNQEKIASDAWAVSTTWYTEACARTVFQLVPYTGAPDSKDRLFTFDDDALHFGQKFHIQACLPTDAGEPLYLASFAKTPQRFARYSREQEVSVSRTKSWNTVFEVVCLDPTYRLEVEGQAVQSHTPFALMHSATRVFLASDKAVPYRNDFGQEYELFCRTYQDTQRGQLGQRDRKMLAAQNRFCFVNSTNGPPPGSEE